MERIPEEVTTRYERLIYEALAFKTPEPLLLHFTEEGQNEAARFGAEAERELLDGGRLDFDRGWGNKFPGYVFRLAALFHLCAALDGGQDLTSPVGVEWLQAAEAVGWCLARHTESIFTEAEADPDVENAKYILKRLQKRGERDMSKHDLQVLCDSKRFKSAGSMERALELLEERGFIRRVPIQTGNPGRPKEKIFVNLSAIKTN